MPKIKTNKDIVGEDWKELHEMEDTLIECLMEGIDMRDLAYRYFTEEENKRYLELRTKCGLPN